MYVLRFTMCSFSFSFNLRKKKLSWGSLFSLGSILFMPVIKEVCVMHVNRNIVLFIFLGLTGFVIWILIKVLIGVLVLDDHVKCTWRCFDLT